ncbi:hypothetical protein ACHAWF_016211 [Thalassiosira exigua]
MHHVGGKLSTLRINELRKKLHERGLDIDGFINFAMHSDIVDGLVEAALVIKVRMRGKESSPYSQPFIAVKPLRSAMLKLFLDEESADVVFQFDGGGCQIINTQKCAPTSQVNFHAHRFILKQCASNLSDLCGSEPGLISVPITNMKPEAFRLMFYYIYGGELTEDDFKASSKEIIKVANKFGVVNLKLEVEVCFVKYTEIRSEIVLELMLYADSVDCERLKEAVSAFIVKNTRLIIDNVTLKEAPVEFLVKILVAMSRHHSDLGGKFSMLQINELRKKLHHEIGLNINGSGETLLVRLQEGV